MLSSILPIPHIPIGAWFDALIDFLSDNFGFIFDGFEFVISILTDAIFASLTLMPDVVYIVLFTLGAYWLSKKIGLAVFMVLALLFVVSMGYWEDMLYTFSLVITAAFIALIIGIPIGILASRNDRLHDYLIRPVLDFMQTLPAFVYLIPAVSLYGIGETPGVFATIIFAMPPAVRLTNLGIRQVSSEVIEAGRSLGSTDKQMLLKVQLPIAMPSIMAGINQTIMLALSMVVIGAMLGGRGLGTIVYGAVGTNNIPVGFESGVAVVLLAVILDRTTQAIGDKTSEKR